MIFRTFAHVRNFSEYVQSLQFQLEESQRARTQMNESIQALNHFREHAEVNEAALQ